MSGALERRDIRVKVYPFSGAIPLDDIEDIIDKIQKATIKACLKNFKGWLLKQARKDSSRNFRQTKAYELYLRLEREE